MDSNPFAKIEDAVSALLERLERLALENKSLKDEIDGLKGNHKNESEAIAILRKEKDELEKQLKNSEPHSDQKREERIRNHIDSILKKLKELQTVLE